VECTNELRVCGRLFGGHRLLLRTLAALGSKNNTPPMEHLLNCMRFWVSVPVLSVKMYSICKRMR